MTYMPWQEGSLEAHYGMVSGALNETIPRWAVNTDSATGLVSATLRLQAIYLPKGLVVTNVVWRTGATASGTLTHGWFGLWDSGRVSLALTADQTSGTLAANTNVSKALSAPFTTTYEGLHYLGICYVTAGTVPSFLQYAGSALSAGIAPILGGASSTSQTTPPAAGVTATAITSAANQPYAYVT